MNNPRSALPIGIFDSGVGGISVLVEIIKALPHEEFYYFADTLHAPYGTKPENTVKALAMDAAEFLSHRGVKSLVVACNTATSAAINDIRGAFPFPVIGMEPAAKPAVELGRKGKILVMATPLTLKSKKYHDLACQYQHLADILPLPCPELVELIEQGHFHGPEIEGYLSRIFAPLEKDGIAAIVLGCTHYVLIKREIVKIAGDVIRVVDGNYGTARHLKTVLHREKLLKDAREEIHGLPRKTKIRFYISGNEREVITRCKQILQLEDVSCEPEFFARET